MPLLISDDHHDTRTCEGIADSRCLGETRAEEGVQSTQSQVQALAEATDDVRSGVLAGSSKGYEIGARENAIGDIPGDAPGPHDDPTFDAHAKDSNNAFTTTSHSEDLVLATDDLVPTVESVTSAVALASDTCLTANFIEEGDFAPALEDLSKPEKASLGDLTNQCADNHDKEMLCPTENGANRTQETQRIPPAQSNPSSNAELSDLKHAGSRKLLVLTPDFMDAMDKMEKRFYAEKANWLMRKRVLDDDILVIDASPDEDAPKSECSSNAEQTHSLAQESDPIGTLHGTNECIGVDLEQDAADTEENSREVPDDWVQQIIQKAEERKARLKSTRHLPSVAPVSDHAICSSSFMKDQDTEEGLWNLWNTTLDETLGIRTTGCSLERRNATNRSAAGNFSKSLARNPVPLAVRGLKIARYASAGKQRTLEDYRAQAVSAGCAPAVSDITLVSSSSDLSTGLEEWLEDMDSGSGGLIQLGAFSSYAREEQDWAESSCNSSSTEWSTPTTPTSCPFPLSEPLQSDEISHVNKSSAPRKKYTFLSLCALVKNTFKTRRPTKDATERQTRLASAHQSPSSPTVPGRLPPSNAAGRASGKKGSSGPTNISTAGTCAGRSTMRPRQVIASPPGRPPPSNSALLADHMKGPLSSNAGYNGAGSERESTSGGGPLAGPGWRTPTNRAFELRRLHTANKLLGEQTKVKEHNRRISKSIQRLLPKLPHADDIKYVYIQSDLSCSSLDVSVDGAEGRSMSSSPESSPPSTPISGPFPLPAPVFKPTVPHLPKSGFPSLRSSHHNQVRIMRRSDVGYGESF